jgi:hypothetical protein
MEPPSTEPPSKEQQALSAAIAMNRFEETVDPKDSPTLDSKNICLKTDKDISPVLRDIMKLSKKVRSVSLLKVLKYNDTTTSLVEVPCSAKQLGFKKQARQSRWVQRILQCVRKYKEGELVADNEKQEDNDDEFAYNQGAQGDPETDDVELSSTFYAILDRTGPLGNEDTLVLNVPISVFITGDLAFYATVVGKEGMDKAHCHWCKLPSAQWQTHGHAPGSKWTLEELKRVTGSITPTKRIQNGVKNYPQLDCVELERCIFPVLHVTLGLANRLLRHTIDYADLVVKRTPEVLRTARILQIEAAHKYATIKQEIVDWEICNGPTLANMYLAQGHLNEQIEVEGGLTEAEREAAILDAASLKSEIALYLDKSTQGLLVGSAGRGWGIGTS